MKLHYDNYIFDLYGTLIDIRTDENDRNAWEKMALLYRYYGAVYEADELRCAYVSEVRAALDASRAEHGGEPERPEPDTAEIRIENVFRRLYERKGVCPDEALVLWTCQMFRIVTTVYIRLFPQVKERLGQLRRNGAHTYLLTNAQRVFTENELRMFGLEEYFDGIFISSDHYRKKPDVRFYRRLIDTYGLDPSRSLMCGDDAVCDVAGAQNAGMEAFLVRHRPVRRGSRRSLDGAEARDPQAAEAQNRGKKELVGSGAARAQSRGTAEARDSSAAGTRPPAGTVEVPLV